MAGEIQYRHTDTGKTIYAVVVNSLGQYYVGVNPEALNVSHWDTYDIPLIETDVGNSYFYTGDFPNIASGTYDVLIFEQAGGLPDISDEQLNENTKFDWTGSAVSSSFESVTAGVVISAAGLDNISMTEPVGVASNFREVIIQLWRRFFGKSILNSTTNTLKCYNTVGDTVITTQTFSETATTQTMGESS